MGELRLLSSELSQREGEVLLRVIEEYVKGRNSVGSRVVASTLPYSSATVRNVMSDLEKKGFLRQLHAVSGRVPTFKALLLYLNSVISLPDEVGEDVRDVIEKVGVELFFEMVFSEELRGVVIAFEKIGVDVNRIKMVPLSNKTVIVFEGRKVFEIPEKLPNELINRIVNLFKVLQLSDAMREMGRISWQIFKLFEEFVDNASNVADVRVRGFKNIENFGNAARTVLKVIDEALKNPVIKGFVPGAFGFKYADDECLCIMDVDFPGGKRLRVVLPYWTNWYKIGQYFAELAKLMDSFKLRESLELKRKSKVSLSFYDFA